MCFLSVFDFNETNDSFIFYFLFFEWYAILSRYLSVVLYLQSISCVCIYCTYNTRKYENTVNTVYAKSTVHKNIQYTQYLDIKHSNILRTNNNLISTLMKLNNNIALHFDEVCEM